MLRSRSYLLALAAIFSTVGTAEAAAAAGRLQLEWTAPADCPDQSAVERRLVELLGAPADSLLSRDFRALAEIVAKADGFELHLRTETAEGDRGSRQLEAATCEKLAAAGAVIIALAISPEAVQKHSAKASAAFETMAERASNSPLGASSSPTPEPHGSRQEPQESAPAASVNSVNSVNRANDKAPPNDGRSSSLARGSRFSSRPGAPKQANFEVPRLVAGLSGNIDAGTLPGVAPGVAVALGWDGGRFRVELDAVLLPARFASAEEEPRKGGDISLLAAGPGLCYRVLSGVAILSTCAGVEYGNMQGIGRNLREENEQNVPWLAARAGLSLGLVRQGPFTLRARAQAIVPLGRGSFHFRREDSTLEEVHKPARVAGRFGLGFELAF